MPHHRLCWFFRLLSIFEVLSLGTGNISKYGCIGDSLELYSNISFDIDFTLVSVYKNGVNNILIAAWSVHNFTINSTFINGHTDKMSLDKKGSIWIYRLHISDEAKYSIAILNGSWSSDDVVQLGVLVAPTTNCIPKIKRVKDVLTVFIDHNVCGRPLATVYWLNHSGIEHTETKVIQLQTGKRAGTYYACIKSDALKCAKVSRFSDHCSFLNIEEDEPSTGQEGVGTFKNNTVQDNFPQVSDIVGPLHLLIKKATSETVHTTVNMIVEQLKDVVVKPIVESNVKQLARLEEMYKKILEEKQMVIDEKQKLINEKEVLLESKDTTIKTLESKMENLEDSFDDIQQNGLGSSLRLNNVNLGKDESCEEKVVDVITNMANVSISRDDIDRCHPLGKPNKNGNRQLMIKFKSFKTKAKVFSQRKNMKGNDQGIYMIDDLTRPKPDLLNKLLKYKTSKRIETFWIVDGKIYARKYPGSYPKRINSMQDIEHLLINAESSLFANNEGKH